LATASVGDVETAEIVLGERARSILGEAESVGLVRLDDDSSLSLHPLLSDLLLERVREQGAPRDGRTDRFLPLVDTGRWDEALAAAETVPDPDFVALALERALPELLRSGRATTLRRWVAAGRKANGDRGLVDYVEAELALRDADFARAIALGESATESLRGDLKAKAHLVAGRASNLADSAERAMAHFYQAETAAEAAETLSDALWGKFMQTGNDEVEAARWLLSDFEARSPRDAQRAIRSINGRLFLAALDGPLETTIEQAQPTLELIRERADALSGTAFLNIYSPCLSVLGRYQDALAAADLEMAIASEYELEFVRRHAKLNRARAFIGLREIAQAERCLAHLDCLTDETDLFLSANRLIERARLQITVGDLEKAQAHLFFDPNPRLTPATRGNFFAMRSIVLAGLGRFHEARLAARAAAVTRYVQARTVVDIGAALAHSGGEERVWAKRSTKAFKEAASAGGFDAIVMACRISTRFASTLASNREHRGVLAAVLTRSNDIALACRVGLVIPRAARDPSPLSPREREVHALIAQGRTNREIASALYISESTTKLHVRHIFEKLRVRSRVEAVRAWRTDEDRGPTT
jgi:ATP/maltotriose-dependent transcriptional regulator MalT